MKNDPTFIVVHVDSELFNMSTCFRKSTKHFVFYSRYNFDCSASSKYKITNDISLCIQKSFLANGFFYSERHYLSKCISFIYYVSNVNDANIFFFRLKMDM